MPCGNRILTSERRRARQTVGFRLMPLNDVDHRLSPPPSDGYVYRTAWRVATGDIGADLELRLDSVARYLQEVGAENLVDAGEAEQYGTASSELSTEGLGRVHSRQPSHRR